MTRRDSAESSKGDFAVATSRTTGRALLHPAVRQGIVWTTVSSHPAPDISSPDAGHGSALWLDPGGFTVRPAGSDPTRSILPSLLAAPPRRLDEYGPRLEVAQKPSSDVAAPVQLRAVAEDETSPCQTLSNHSPTNDKSFVSSIISLKNSNTDITP
ncbi:MAG: hypothetical protein NTX53_05165 [candidate division WOR-3 bacterium]|nr:hypothetical protein [candidate division WOR-3 bacterium]